MAKKKTSDELAETDATSAEPIIATSMDAIDALIIAIGEGPVPLTRYLKYRHGEGFTAVLAGVEFVNSISVLSLDELDVLAETGQLKRGYLQRLEAIGSVEIIEK